jgi:hypothetical protein
MFARCPIIRVIIHFMNRTLLLSLFATATCAPILYAADAEWVNLFNGKDLSNWVNVNCAPETWTVADGVIKSTGKPTGALRTPRMYENFIMEVEWRHLESGGNAGIFIWGSPIAAPGVPFLRAIEVQVLDNGYGNTESHTTHGDVFPIHGATMTPFGKHNGQRAFPSEFRSKPAPEWNHYRIECRDGVIRLSVNGKEVSGGENCVWRKGYLGLESEGAPTEWRVVKIQELPPGIATPEQTAPEAQGHRPLYTGVDLRGWKSETLDHWQSSDWKLVQKAGEAGKPLWTEAEFGDCELVIDCKVGKDAKDKKPAVLVGLHGPQIELPIAEPGKWGRYTITLKGGTFHLTGPEGADRSGAAGDLPPRRPFGLLDIGGDVEFGNIYIRDL